MQLRPWNSTMVFHSMADRWTSSWQHRKYHNLQFVLLDQHSAKVKTEIKVDHSGTKVDQVSVRSPMEIWSKKWKLPSKFRIYVINNRVFQLVRDRAVATITVVLEPSVAIVQIQNQFQPKNWMPNWMLMSMTWSCKLILCSTCTSKKTLAIRNTPTQLLTLGIHFRQ